MTVPGPPRVALAPPVARLVHRAWGGASAFLDRSRRLRWADLLVLAAVAGLLVSLVRVEREWAGQLRPAVSIRLSPLALPRYALLSLSRGIIAYALSLVFTLGYGFWAAKDRLAERVLVPLLDILQSIPVLGFMPGFVLALVALFPSSNVGLELAAVLMIFTGQVWNMTFSFYQSLRSVPADLGEVATAYRFSAWQRLEWVELPHATMGLVWNSMMSMAGGWFFLMVSESFVLGKKDFRLPGIGSYMSVAAARGDVAAMVWAVVAMTVMIVMLDQLVWRPVVVWAQKFRTEDTGSEERASSWLLDLLRRSRILRGLARRARARRRLTEARHSESGGGREGKPAGAASVAGRRPITPGAAGERAGGRAGPTGAPSVAWPARLVPVALFALLVAALLLGVWRLAALLRYVGAREWWTIASSASWTLGRVLASTALGTLWALPAGLAIGLSPRVSRALQPVVQVAASFPAPMLFPAAIVLFKLTGVGLGWGSILLMLLGTQWYILFNVIAGAMAIPADLREVARSYRVVGRSRFLAVYLPAVFPYLVTGWVTAAGGAWNASIVAEYVTFRGEVMTAHGLGAEISRAAERGDFSTLAASVLVMSTVVVLFNRTVWRRLYRVAEERCSLAR